MERMSSAWVDLKKSAKVNGRCANWRAFSRTRASDPDTKRVWWSDAGVHQDITFPVHPDPVSGMHCWHQMVRVERAGSDDRYGDIFVDTNLSFAVYQRWKALARPRRGRVDCGGRCGFRALYGRRKRRSTSRSSEYPLAIVAARRPFGKLRAGYQDNCREGSVTFPSLRVT